MEFYTGKPSRRVKHTRDILLNQVNTVDTLFILGNNNRRLLKPILNNYYDWIRKRWQNEDADVYSESLNEHIAFYIVTMKATPIWGTT
jgi:hypothetical protein